MAFRTATLNLAGAADRGHGRGAARVPPSPSEAKLKAAAAASGMCGWAGMTETARDRNWSATHHLGVARVVRIDVTRAALSRFCQSL